MKVLSLRSYFVEWMMIKCALTHSSELIINVLEEVNALSFYDVKARFLVQVAVNNLQVSRQYL